MFPRLYVSPWSVLQSLANVCFPAPFTTCLCFRACVYHGGLFSRAWHNLSVSLRFSEDVRVPALVTFFCVFLRAGTCQIFCSLRVELLFLFGFRTFGCSYVFFHLLISVDFHVTPDHTVKATLNTVPGKPLFCSNDYISRVIER